MGDGDVPREGESLPYPDDAAMTFRLIAEGTYDWESWITPRGVPGWINPSVTRLTGRSIADCLNMADYPMPVIHPDDRRRMRRHLADALAGGSGNDVDFRILHADGRTVWGAMSWQPLTTVTGRRNGYRTSVRDITDRKTFEGALRRAEERSRDGEVRMRLFLDNVPGALAMFDRQMRYLVVSQRWLDDYGLTGQPVIGRSHYEVFPEIGEYWRSVHRRGLAGEVIRCDGEPFDRADGTTQWVAWEVTPWRTSSGHVGGILIASQDITERKMAERELAAREEQVRELLSRERAISLRLQLALLPERIVQHPWLQVAARYQAVAELLTVGGDWYDTFAWPDGHVGLMVGDVVGHDLDAAARMGRLRAAVAAVVPLTPAHPGAVLDALDRCAAGPDGAPFVTSACAVIDPLTGAMRYSRAGHPPPVLVRPDRTTIWLEDAQTPPVGTAFAGTRTEAITDLEPGSMVVLYSDGLVERRGENLSDGLERLAKEVAAGPDDPHGLVEHLVNTLGSTGAEDDIVVLCARWSPPPAVLRCVLSAHVGDLAQARHQLAHWLGLHAVTGERQDAIVLAVNEAASNSIEHAYFGQPAGGVVIEAERIGRRVIARVRDHGTWRPPHHDPDRGRGQGIMRAVSDDFRCVTTPDGTTITLSFKVMDG